MSDRTVTTETATLAGGCFWCLEAVYSDVRGVQRVISGYAGGTVAFPTYDQVCSGRTGHAEAVQITFDPNAVSYRELLEVFYAIHDPTTRNRQGADAGTQYRSAIFTSSPEQEQTAREVLDEQARAGAWRSPIVTEITPLDRFYPAEAEHQNYFERNPNAPYCQIVIAPKVARARQKLLARLKG